MASNFLGSQPNSNDMMAFAQFITALATTAKEKKRVTAKPTNTDTDNMRFSMRVFCIGLGLVGSKYSRIRALMTKSLPGNGAWRYFQNEKAVEEAATEPQPNEDAAELPDNAAGEAPTDELPADARPETEDANVGDTNADTAEIEGEVKVDA